VNHEFVLMDESKISFVEYLLQTLADIELSPMDLKEILRLSKGFCSVIIEWMLYQNKKETPLGEPLEILGNRYINQCLIN